MGGRGANSDSPLTVHILGKLNHLLFSGAVDTMEEDGGNSVMLSDTITLLLDKSFAAEVAN